MQTELERLLDIMALLRDPKDGCPWDVEQTFSTIAHHTIEEAYEVADAIQRGDMEALKDELGDLLLQVIFHSQMAREAGLFAFADVATAICEKLVRRHPHVFEDAHVNDAVAQTRAWEDHKAAERRATSTPGDAPPGALAGVTAGLPALSRALKLQKRAARVGFDWANATQTLAKVREEVLEVEGEMEGMADRERLEDEIGDLLFASVNLARKLGIEPDSALRRGNAKFERRFAQMEAMLAKAGKCPEDASLAEMEALWGRVKAGEDTKKLP